MAIWKKKKLPGNPTSSEALRCSFCNKSQHDVKKLIAGPSVLICDECVDICLDIIAEDRVAEGEGMELQAAPVADLGQAVHCSFCGKRTAPVDIPKGTIMCLSCISKRGSGKNRPGGDAPAG